MTIRRRIVYGYALVVGLALSGTAVGFFVGNHYQRQALEASRLATAERELLSDLQVNILYNRPAKQLSPYLNDPQRFQTESQDLLNRVAEIQSLLQNRPDSSGLETREQGNLDLLLSQYAATVAQFQTRTTSFIEQVGRLSETPEDLKAKQALMLNFVQSPEFVAFIEFPDQLAPFADLVKDRQTKATVVLQQAEALRTWIVLGSLLLSAAMAAAIAVYTSRAIAQPVQAVTDVARRVTEENNFDLQAPVQSQDEVGVLANSLNRLIRQVKQLLSELNQKNVDLKTALDQLNQQQTQLVQAEKMSSLGQLVAGVAHEINNPVNFIHGNLAHVQTYTQDLLNFLALYQQHYPQTPAAIRAEAEAIDLEFLQDDLPKMLDSMKVGTSRIRQIVLSLRNFSRMDEAEFKAVDIHEGIDSTLMILQHRLKAKFDRPAIEIVKQYGELPLVECFPGELNQVFMNILANAIDAIEAQAAPGQITIRTAVIDEHVEMAIADNGPGMDDQVISRVFNPFFTTKQVGKGTGMGLSISYQIITERHRGSLTCRSAAGEGTEFTIRIPRRQVLPSAQPTAAQPQLTVC